MPFFPVDTSYFYPNSDAKLQTFIYRKYTRKVSGTRSAEASTGCKCWDRGWSSAFQTLNHLFLLCRLPSIKSWSSCHEIHRGRPQTRVLWGSLQGDTQPAGSLKCVHIRVPGGVYSLRTTAFFQVLFYFLLLLQPFSFLQLLLVWIRTKGGRILRTKSRHDFYAFLRC